MCSKIKDMEEIKKFWIFRAENSNIPGRINRRSDIAEEKVYKVEDKTTEMDQSEKRRGKNEEHISEPWGIFQQTSNCSP
jgi:hypothetical protein